MAYDYAELEKLMNSFVNGVSLYEKFINDFLGEMGLRVFAQTKKLTPVDTGNLRLRWELSRVYRIGNELHIMIFNPVEYASFVEDGHMQHRRFLPIKYLEESKANEPYLNFLYEKYGDDIAGVMLQDKWIPGVHMARISINRFESELPARYNKALERFLYSWG